MTLQHDDARMARTWAIYQALIHTLVGREDSFGHICYDADLAQALYEASDADRDALERLTTTYWTLRKAYFSVADLAKLWHISERMVRRLAQSGALQGGTRRGRWQFSQKAVDRFIAAHTYSGGLRIEIPPLEADGMPDADLLARARADMEGMDWRTNDLTGYVNVSHDRAYQLVLAWRSAGAVEHAAKRGWWRFTTVEPRE
jgi:Helix-turn-helix domain